MNPSEIPHHPNPTRTDGIFVRAVEPEDYRGLKEIYEQPNAYFGTLQMPLPTYEEWRERVAKHQSNRYNLVACNDQGPVGNIGLWLDGNPRRRHAANIGMGVHDDHAGQGIGELLMTHALNIADNWLNLTRVELSVYVDNTRAIKLYERCGFEVEGTLRRYAFRAGEYVDALQMSRLR